MTPTDLLHVMARIVNDPDARDLSTDALARRAGWSARHVHRAFVVFARETPKAWTTRVRLARATALLRGGEAVGDAAARAGFGSPEVLARTVRRTFGTTPSSLRAGGPPGAAPCLTLHHLSLLPRRPPVSSPAVTEQRRAAQPVLFVRRAVPTDGLQAAMADILPAVWSHCHTHGVALVGPPYTRYVEMRRGGFTIESGFPVAPGAVGAGEIVLGELPGGPVAVATHCGPYDTLPETHAALEAWAGARAAGGPWESYVTDPGEHPDPADWRTEVVLPLSA